MNRDECIEHYEDTGDTRFDTVFHGNRFVIVYDHAFGDFRLESAEGNIFPPETWQEWQRY